MTLQVQTVTTSDQSLLAAVRETLEGADRSILCVAYAHTRGVHLLESELRASPDTRLVVTTAFDQNNGAAISLAASMGVQVRTLNPGSGSSYHPKVYLSRRGRRIDAVVGSANLTGGLATNIEAGGSSHCRADSTALLREPDASSTPNPEEFVKDTYAPLLDLSLRGTQCGSVSSRLGQTT